MDYTNRELLALLERYSAELGLADAVYQVLARDYHFMYDCLYHDKPTLAQRLEQCWREEELVYRMNIEDIERKLQALFRLIELAQHEE